MKVKVLSILLILSSLSIAIVNAEQQYNHVISLESETPKSNLWFGYQMAVSDNIILTSEKKATVNGIPNAGKAHIYDSSGNLITSLQSPSPGTSYEFGGALDLYKNMAAVHEAAHFNDTNWVGKVHVFNTNGTLKHTLQPQEFYKYNLFGKSISIGEDVLAITEKGVEMSPAGQGKVHIYTHGGKFVKTIYPPNPAAQAVFGNSLEIGEGLLLIGQWGDIWEIGPGYVYVYDLDGTLLMTLEAPVKEELACFGNAIGISGEYIVIGEYKATVDGLKYAGKVHVYNTGGEFLRTLVSPVPESNSWFGSDVAISGDIIVVGEELGNVEPFGEEGRAYVFNVDGTLIQNLTAFEPSPRGAFGLGLDIEGDTVVVGESWAEVDGQPDSGRLHVYWLGAQVDSQEQVEETTSETEADTEPRASIPGYPLLSVGTALVSFYMLTKKEIGG